MPNLQCPVCKADNASGPACRRCKADLGMLIALERQRENHLVEAEGALAGDCVSDGLRAASAAHGIRAGADSSRLLALAYLLNQQFEEAWRAYQSTDHHG